MIFGKVTILFALIATVISALYYLMAAKSVDKPKKAKQKDDSDAFRKYGRLAFYFMTAMTATGTFYLFYLFLTHQFQVQYVYQYSSRSLPIGLLISSLWAGQQGSFLFWVLVSSIMGLFLIRSAGKFENYSMFFLNIIQGFFLVLLIKASPFETSFPVPPDGSGLNPLLQNFWMIIHPPILFIGYAAIAFPLVLSFAALIQKEYSGWVTKAFPWTIISSITLGSGIIIGAFWAYETLGWGGYWGWDPVENSSLIPWLTILALLHGLILQKRNNALAKTNFFFAIISYVLVLYATFLTRSGVLADFSVHSFQNLGINGLLIIFMMTVIGIGVLLFLPRMKEFPHQNIDFSRPNRENAMVAGIWVLSASAFLVFIGTSSPLISGLFGDPSQVDTSFYNKVNLPIGILMALLLSITPYLFWAEKSVKEIPRRVLLPLVLAVVSTAGMIYYGLSEILNLVFFFFSAFAMWSSIFIIIRNSRVNWLNIAGPLSHFGVAIMLIGIIGSGYFSITKRVVLDQDKPMQVFDYQLTYKGFSAGQDGKNLVTIEVADDGGVYVAQPRLYQTKYNEGVMREPDIKPGLLTDLYISPLENRQSGGESKAISFSLIKGETRELSGYQITFTGFNMSNHDGGGKMSVGADLKIVSDGIENVITPVLLIGSDGREMVPAALPHIHSSEKHNHATIAVAGLNADDKRIDLVIKGLDGSAEEPSEQLLIEISQKPFMSIMWIGTLVLILGSFVSYIRRVKMD